MKHNGWQYGQWRFAGHVTIHRYKPLCGSEWFKLHFPAIGYIACGRFVVFCFVVSLFIFSLCAAPILPNFL
jgi:hypothetical protein